LDLSFNRIKRIEGLDALVRLRELSLAANEIEELSGGLDALAASLETLSLGRNKLATVPQLLRLRKFARLTSLSLAGNPMPTAEYTSYALAHLPGLRYLDFRLVEDSARRTARAEHATSVAQLEAEDAAARAGAEEQRKVDERLAELKQANLLGVETLLADLLKADADLRALSVLPSLQEPREEYG
jgi:hypothetical protein